MFQCVLQRGQTPLHVAVANSASLEVLKLLMEAHFDAVKEKDLVSRGTSRSNVLADISLNKYVHNRLSQWLIDLCVVVARHCVLYELVQTNGRHLQAMREH